VYILADLGAGADRRPGIDHRAFVDVRADVDVRGHQDHVPADERAASGGRRRHDAEAALEELLAVVGCELVWYLVEIAHHAAIDQTVLL